MRIWVSHMIRAALFGLAAVAGLGLPLKAEAAICGDPSSQMLQTCEIFDSYCAGFLADPADDGRVAEVTLNRNLNEEGLTRLAVSYQPMRPHTRNLLPQGEN